MIVHINLSAYSTPEAASLFAASMSSGDAPLKLFVDRERATVLLRYRSLPSSLSDGPNKTRETEVNRVQLRFTHVGDCTRFVRATERFCAVTYRSSAAVPASVNVGQGPSLFSQSQSPGPSQSPQRLRSPVLAPVAQSQPPPVLSPQPLSPSKHLQSAQMESQLPPPPSLSTVTPPAHVPLPLATGKDAPTAQPEADTSNVRTATQSSNAVRLISSALRDSPTKAPLAPRRHLERLRELKQATAHQHAPPPETVASLDHDEIPQRKRRWISEDIEEDEEDESGGDSGAPETQRRRLSTVEDDEAGEYQTPMSPVAAVSSQAVQPSNDLVRQIKALDDAALRQAVLAVLREEECSTRLGRALRQAVALPP